MVSGRSVHLCTIWSLRCMRGVACGRRLSEGRRVRSIVDKFKEAIMTIA